MRKFFLLIFFVFHFIAAKSQQAPLYSHFFLKEMMFNPAFTGNGAVTSAALFSRLQWIDFKNSPQQNLFILDGALPNQKIRFGADLFSDKKGISSRIGGNFSVAYQLPIGEDANFAAGISVGIVDHTFHFSEAVIEDPTDPVITGASQRSTSITASAGIAFGWKGLQIGLAAAQIPSSALTYQDNTSGKINYSIARSYNASVKYELTLSEAMKMSLTPIVVAYYTANTPLKYDANLNLEWNNKVWIGATWKSDYAVAANAGFCISKHVKVGYSYDFIIGNVGKYSGMSHEIYLGFVFGGKAHENIPADTTALMQMRSKADSLEQEVDQRDAKARAQQDKIKQLEKDLEAQKKSGAAANNPVNQTDNTGQQNTAQQNANTGDAGKNQQGNSTQPTGNQNEAGLAATADKQMKNGIWVLTMPPGEISYLNAGAAKPGYYVVTGTFYYRDFAETELKRVKERGFTKAVILFSSARQFHYIAAEYVTDSEKALSAAQRLRESGSPDAWVMYLPK